MSERVQKHFYSVRINALFTLFVRHDQQCGNGVTEPI